MSAISGIVNLAGGPVDTAALDAMSRAGLARGPDVHRRWTSDSAAFDYRGISPCWSAGPEEHLVHDADSGVTALLCGRIDGGATLLQSYLASGPECGGRLIGEFAFAIWDARQRILILGRDPGGVGQLFYTVRPDGSVRFATGLNQLLASPDVARKPDFEGILDFYLTRGAVNPEASLIAGTRRVPPASIVILTRAGVTVRRYWTLENAISQTQWIPPAELPDACAAALQDAIRDRLRGQTAVGLMLSGGWDSGVIFQLWQWMRSRGENLAEPRVYSYYYSGYPEMDERREIAALLRRWPAPASISRYECAGALPGLEAHSAELGIPEANFTWRQTRQLAARARAEGVRVMLNGEGGNHIFECSRLRTADLLLRFRWRAAAEQNRIFSSESGRPPSPDFWLRDIRHVSRVLLPRTMAAAARIRDRVAGREPFGAFRPPFRSLILSLSRTPARRGISQGPIGSYAAWQEREAFQALTSEYSNLGSILVPEGVALSSPFLDARVVPLALRGMTSESKPSISRSFLAAAIATRLGKSDWCGKYAFCNGPLEKTIHQDLASCPSLFEVKTSASLGLVDPAALRQAFPGLESGDPSPGLGGMWKFLNLEAWAAIVLA